MTTLPRLACVAVLGLAACGWVGDAAAQQDPWPELANQVFNGRPLVDGKEEIGSGAKAMLKDGLYTRWPKPQFALGFLQLIGKK